MSAAKVVVIEDEPDILELIEYNLRREGFEVVTAANGRAGLSVIGREKPDLVLLDLLLPGLDGLDVCRRLRAVESTRDLPVIMVTARGEESDVVLGLGVGADDYIHKPFSPRELIARVRAVLRRGPLRESDPDQRVVRGPLVVDPVRHRVAVDGRRLEFTPTEFASCTSWLRIRAASSPVANSWIGRSAIGQSSSTGTSTFMSAPCARNSDRTAT